MVDDWSTQVVFGRCVCGLGAAGAEEGAAPPRQPGGLVALPAFSGHGRHRWTAPRYPVWHGPLVGGTRAEQEH